MATAVLDRYLTGEEIIAGNLGDGCEYIDGEFVRRNVSVRSSLIAVRISTRLFLHSDEGRLGIVLDSEQWMQFFPEAPHDMRRPDVAFLASYPGDLGILRIAPDLVVEVVSPGDAVRNARAKIGLWLRSGVKMVWLVWPSRREVDVYLAEDTYRTLKDDEVIEGGAAVPGFTCPISRFFPPMD